MENLVQWPRAKWWEKAWNPVIGCKPCSPACENCYAAAWARRFRQSFEPHSTKQRPPRKGVVFCGNMTDLFGEWMLPYNNMPVTPEDLISSADGNKATYIWLTKRVQNMCDSLSIGKFSAVDEEGDVHYVPVSSLNLSNHYFGFTAENQAWYEKRLEPFLESFPKWAKAWISAEPLLGRLGLMFQNPHIREKIHWVVVGCESGRNRRDCPIEYVEDIVRQCREHNVKVFVKQLSIDGKCVNDITKFPKHLQIRQVPWATTEKGSAE